MMHLVQFGVPGWVGRFRAADGRVRRRGCQVVLRTPRGLETGAVLRPASDSAAAGSCDGELLRRLTPDDRLIVARIERFRDRAFQACSELLRQRGLPAVLVDVEQLFDGQSLYFYFLGEVTDELSALTDELAEAWEAKVRFRRFTERLIEGCGPDCGTGASGCGTTGCGSCALRGGCATPVP
jgi:cell fate regulator YaaT (PSP1 superfamily)